MDIKNAFPLSPGFQQKIENGIWREYAVPTGKRPVSRVIGPTFIPTGYISWPVSKRIMPTTF
jgi:hypothetical protein